MNAAATASASSADPFDTIFDFAREVSAVAEKLLRTPAMSDAYIKPEELKLPEGDGLVRRAHCLRAMSFYVDEAGRQPGAKRDLLLSLGRAYRIRHAAEAGTIKTAAPWRYAVTPEMVLVRAEDRTREEMRHAISTDIAARAVASSEIANLLSAMAMKMDIGAAGKAKVDAWRKSYDPSKVQGSGASATP